MVIAILHEREIFTKFFKWIHLINHDIYSFSCLLVNNHAFAWIFVIYMCVGYITVPGNLVSPTTPWETNSVGRWTYRANWTTRSVTPSTLSSASNTLVSSYLDDCFDYSSLLYIYKNFFFELSCNVRNLEDLVYFISDLAATFHNNSGDNYGRPRHNHGHAHPHHEESRAHSEDNHLLQPEQDIYCWVQTTRDGICTSWRRELTRNDHWVRQVERRETSNTYYRPHQQLFNG